MEKLEDSVAFGAPWDEERRRILVDQLCYSLAPDVYLPPTGSTEDLQWAREEIAPFLQDGRLKAALQSSPELLEDVLVQWLNFVDQEAVKITALSADEYQADFEQLEQLEQVPAKDLAQLFPDLEKGFQDYFQEEEVPLAYYREQYQYWREPSPLPTKFDARTHKILRQSWQILRRLDQSGILSLDKVRALGIQQLGKLGLDPELVDLLLDAFETRKASGDSTKVPPAFAQEEQKAKPPRPSLEDLKRNLIQDARRALAQRQAKAELEAIDTARKALLQRLYQEFDDYEKLKEILGPFTGYLGRGFDLSKGQWQQAEFDLLKRYAELLKGDTLLQELVDLLGRMRAAEIELEEEEFEALETYTHWELSRAAQEEIVGLQESNDLNRLLPVEAALLSHPDTELLFYQKYAESRLQTYLLHGRTAVEEERIIKQARNKEKELPKGPFIICVDTSGSMHGTPEQVAKLLAFALTKLALQDNRQVFLISFSTGVQTRELTSLDRSLDELIAFLQMSFHGGTDAAPALTEALRQLDTQAYKKADVLMVSDFVMPTLPEAVGEQITAAQKKGTRFFALTVSSAGNAGVLKGFDYSWQYDPRDQGALKEVLRELRKTL